MGRDWDCLRLAAGLSEAKFDACADLVTCSRRACAGDEVGVTVGGSECENGGVESVLSHVIAAFQGSMMTQLPKPKPRGTGRKLSEGDVYFAITPGNYRCSRRRLHF